MAIGFKKFGYVRGVSAWREMQAWRERRYASNESFSSLQSAGSNITGVLANQSQGLSELVGKIAAARVKSEALARIDKARDRELDKIV